MQSDTFDRTNNVGLTFQGLILTILAANYLDVDDLLTKLFIRYKLLKDKNRGFENLIYENNGFTEYEKQFLNSRQSHLDNFHVERIRSSPDSYKDYGLLDLPKDLFNVYYFDKLPYDLNFGYARWFEYLLEFRAKHAYFWHLTTNYIIREFRNRYTELLSDLSDDQVFQIAEYISRDPTKGILGDYALKGSDVPNFRTMTHIEVLVVAIKKHRSISQMEVAVEAIRRGRDRARQKKEDSKEAEKRLADNVIFNKQNISNYVKSLGYSLSGNLPIIPTYRVEDFENNVLVKEYIANIEKEINQVIMTKPLNFQKLQIMATPKRLRELFLKVELDEEKRKDDYFIITSKFLKDHGHFLSREEILNYGSTNANVILRILEAKKEKLRIAQEELESKGYNVSTKIIIELNYNIENIIKRINSSSLDVIRANTISWEAFLNVLKYK